MVLSDQLRSLPVEKLGTSEIAARFTKRLSQGNFTRDENSSSHFCVYFLPVNREIGEVFVVDHKKAKQWLIPGGHIDKDELLEQTVVREVKEELGVTITDSHIVGPFHIGIADITDTEHTCRTHFHVWYFFITDGKQFAVDMSEFNHAKWIGIHEANNILNEETQQALTKLPNFY